MDKIANSAELQTELRKLLAYTSQPHPSRTFIARELATLSMRMGGELPPEFLKNIKEKKDEAKDDDKKDD
jgi:hypothetical protein